MRISIIYTLLELKSVPCSISQHKWIYLKGIGLLDRFSIYMKKNGLLIDCVHLFANCLIKNSKMGQQTDPKMKDKDISNVKIQQG